MQQRRRRSFRDQSLRDQNFRSRSSTESRWVVAVGAFKRLSTLSTLVISWLIGLAFAIVIWRDSGPALIVAEMQVPELVSKSGYSKGVLQELLAERIRMIDRQAAKSIPRQWRVREAEAPIDVEVPGAKLSARDVIRVIKELLNKRDVTVVESIVERPSALHAYIELQGFGPMSSGIEIDGSGNDVDLLLEKSAKQVLFYTNPNALADAEVDSAEETCNQKSICNFSEAFDVYSYVLSHRPRQEQKWALIGRGYALAKMQDYASAIKQYQRAIELDEHFAPAYNAWGQALYEEKHYESAIGLFQSAARLDTRYAFPINGIGNCLLEIGKAEDARAEFKKAIHIAPKFGFAFNGLGYSSYALHDLNGAAESFRTAIELDPGLASAVLGLANVLQEKGEIDEALEKYEIASHLTPNSYYVYDGWGSALYRSGRKSEAFEKFQRAAQINPSLAHAFSGMGNALHDLGKDSDASEAYAKSASLDPNSAYTYYGWASALNSLGNYSDAEAKFRRAIMLDGKLSGPHIGLAMLYLRNHEIGQAISEFNSGLASADQDTRLNVCSKVMPVEVRSKINACNVRASPVQ
jgi:tetratricopeptide (TPR) repeat protein